MFSFLVLLSRNGAAPRWPGWLLPAAVFTGFALLFLTLYRDRLLPAREVRVATVLATADAAPAGEFPDLMHTGASSLLFQASGWVEPDPHAVKASALVDGVVASLHVLEGQRVEKGALMAKLVDEDAKLKLAAAEGRWRMLTAERNAHLLAASAGKYRRDSLKADLRAAETLGSEARDQLKRFEELRGSGAVSESDTIAARLKLQREEANLAAAKARLEEQLTEISRLEATIAIKDEEIALAQVAVAREKLALDRTRIHAPISGRVLRLVATPGEKKMLGMDHPESSTIAVLYDPVRLQVRVDVPLAEAALLRVGQKTKVYCSLLPDEVFEGEVTRITGEADLQRNTLQAKVRLLVPSDLLRPEMLCRVEFFGSGAGGDRPVADAGDLALWVPAEALRENAVWVVDSGTRRVARRAVGSTTERRDGYARVREGVRPGERVVLSPSDLRDGQRVNPLPFQP